MLEIDIYPLFNANYYSYYVKGLMEKFQSAKFKFNIIDFPQFHAHCLALIIKEDMKVRKIYISAGDGIGFSNDALDWCDVYAKVNINFEDIQPKYVNKILPIGPSFGIQYLPLLETFYESTKTYLLSKNLLAINTREHFANYYRQWKHRLSLENYRPDDPKTGYIFFASSLWKREIENNALRANFIKACHLLRAQLVFEGGFSPRSDMLFYKNYFIEKRYTLKEYINKTKKSFVVFNTPANQSCLGWKLGEFLALGKAIISTPLSRPMPAPLLHGKNVHFVDGSVESIIDAITYIYQNRDYRETLEKNAYQYYLDYLEPRMVVSRIIKTAFDNQGRIL